MKLVDRYLIFEFIRPFLLTVFGITIIMLSSYLFQLTDFIIIKDIPTKIVVKLLLYKLPQIMVQSFSMAVLFSTLLSMSRLVKDNEFTALRMASLNFWRLVIPLLVVGLIISGITYLMNERVVPWANQNYKDIIKYSVHQKTDSKIKKDIFFKGKKERYFHIGEINDKSKVLKQIMVYDKETNINRILTATQGVIKGEVLYLKNGLIYKLNSEGYNTEESKFDQIRINLNLDISDFYDQAKRTSEMNRSELKEKIKLFKASGLDTNNLLVEYHFKLAESLACLIFVLIGAPLSIKSNKGRIFGVIASVIIIFLYYVFLSISRSLGRNGLLLPLIAAWLPNLVFGLVGTYLILKEDYFKI